MQENIDLTAEDLVMLVGVKTCQLRAAHIRANKDRKEAAELAATLTKERDNAKGAFKVADDEVTKLRAENETLKAAAAELESLKAATFPATVSCDMPMLVDAPPELVLDLLDDGDPDGTDLAGGP